MRRRVDDWSEGNHIWVIHQARGRDGWIFMTKFLSCMFIDREGKHKRARPVSSHLEQTSLVNKGFIMEEEPFFLAGHSR